MKYWAEPAIQGRAIHSGFMPRGQAVSDSSSRMPPRPSGSRRSTRVARLPS